MARTLELVGERWTLLIVRELLLHGPRRFHELLSALSIAKNVLSTRLDRMVEHGLVSRELLDDTRDWGLYQLTRKGGDLFPVVNALMAWGDKYAAKDGPPLTIGHRCGGPAGHKLVCETCGERLRLNDLHIAARREKPKPKSRPTQQRKR